MNYIIEIKVDGVTTGVVGPFTDEGAADKYVSDFLEPHLEHAIGYGKARGAGGGSGQ